MEQIERKTANLMHFPNLSFAFVNLPGIFHLFLLISTRNKILIIGAWVETLESFYKVCIIFNLISVIWTGCKIGVATLSISRSRTVKSFGEINTTINII